MHSRLIVGTISAVVWLLAFAAADDITTGHQPDFRLEYPALFASACWFTLVTVWLFRARMWFLGGLSAVALLAAVVGRGAIRPGIVPGLWPEYVASIGAFLWLGVLALVLIASGFGRRLTRAGHV